MAAYVMGLAALWLAQTLSPTDTPGEAPWCGPAKITGYVRTDGNAHTYDGTPIWVDEGIVAASWDVAMGSIAEIEGLGTFRVADRGMLGNGAPMPWVDVAVWSRAEAYALTGVRQVCFRKPPRTADDPEPERGVV